MIRPLLIAALLLISPPLFAAADSPRDVWVKAKCALCHGLDGSGRTKHGTQTNAPDLRSDRVQSLSDELLARSIGGGHRRMPAFRKQLKAKNVQLLVAYIRGLRTPR